MKTAKVLNTLIVVLFIAAVSLPLVFADFEGGKVSDVENRYLAVFPEIVKNGRFVFQPSAFDSWINDNVGGRELAFKLDTEAHFNLFGLSAKKTDLLGKDNWIFYYTQDILDDFTGNNLLQKNELDSITSDLQTISQYLKEKNIQLLLTIAPDKKTIYPEQYPSGIQTATGMRRTQQLVKHLTQNGLNIYTMEDALTAKKNMGTVYSARVDDAHWNYLGGYIGYESIIQKLADLGVPVSCVPLESCEVTVSNYSSLFNGTIPISETWYTITNEKSSSVHFLQEHMDDFDFLTFNKDPANYKRYYVNDDQSLPSLLFIGDSYSQKLFEFLPQSFSRVMFIHTADLNQLPKILDIERFDTVVIEFAERMFSFDQQLLAACRQNVEIKRDQVVLYETVKLAPAVNYTEWGYHFTDYLGTTPSEGNVLTVNSWDATSFMEGWAIDPLAGSVASAVVIQVGDQYYRADYGKERDTVSTYFQNDGYLYSGYTISLDTQELIEAGGLIVHILSADGTYQYPPCVYTIQSK